MVGNVAAVIVIDDLGIEGQKIRAVEAIVDDLAVIRVQMAGVIDLGVIHPSVSLTVQQACLGHALIGCAVMYALFTHIKGKAYMVFRVTDDAKLSALLAKNGIAPVTKEELGLK